MFVFVFIKGTYFYPWYSRTRFLRELFFLLLKEHISVFIKGKYICFIKGTYLHPLQSRIRFMRELFLFSFKEHISVFMFLLKELISLFIKSTEYQNQVLQRARSVFMEETRYLKTRLLRAILFLLKEHISIHGRYKTSSRVHPNIVETWRKYSNGARSWKLI